MREIKFRAWDKKSKAWMYVTLKSLSDCVGISEYAVADTPEDLFSLGKHKTQFTGLKDKNGKEIYEGDIVTSRFIQRNVEIVFEKGKFLPQPVIASEKEFEVIGNIYENPKLVKGD